MLHGYDMNTIIPIKSFIHTNATNKYLALVLPLSNWAEDLYWSTDFFSLSFGIKINDVLILLYSSYCAAASRQVISSKGMSGHHDPIP